MDEASFPSLWSCLQLAMFFSRVRSPFAGRGRSGHGAPAAPVAYQVILEPGIGQFREVESPRVRTLVYIRRDFFLCTN